MRKDKNMLNHRIVYIGDIGEPNTASAIHVRNRVELFGKLGYEMHLVCDTPKNGKKIESNNTIQYHYLVPIEGKGKLRGIKWNIEMLFALKTYFSVKKIIDSLKPEVIILYEVTSIALQNKIRRYCKKNDVKIVIETTEWMEMSKERSLSANLIVLQKDLQKKYTDKRCKNILAISSFLESHYKAQDCNVISIPPTFPTLIRLDEVKNVKDTRCNAKIRLVFAGSLSNKDYLIELIKAILIINKEKIRISFDVIGPSEEDIINYLKKNELKKYGIFVHGRKSHEEVLKIVAEADFSILLRQNKRYAKAGVSTKFCEAMKLGVPSICTQVQGTDIFVDNMKNGILVKDNSVETLVKTLEKIINMDQRSLLEIKQNAYEFAKKEFSIDKYVESMREFLLRCN